MESSEGKKIEKLIDGLAQVVADGFSGFNDKFKQVDKRFDNIDKRFDGVDKRFDGIDAKLKNHDRQFEIINSKLESHDQQFSAINFKLDSMLERIAKVESDIKSIRGVLDDMSFTEIKKIKTNKFLINEVKRLDKEMTMIKKELKID
jgi:chromosome segregation ATPase